MTHILVDTANTFFRARHVIRGDTSEKVGMAIHIMMNSVKKAWQDFGGTHVVFCLEGRSWRKDVYEPYKKNRKVALDKRSAVEQEEDTYWWEAYDDFLNFLKEQTNSMKNFTEMSVFKKNSLMSGLFKNKSLSNDRDGKVTSCKQKSL